MGAAAKKNLAALAAQFSARNRGESGATHEFRPLNDQNAGNERFPEMALTAFNGSDVHCAPLIRK